MSKKNCESPLGVFQYEESVIGKTVEAVSNWLLEQAPETYQSQSSYGRMIDAADLVTMVVDQTRELSNLRTESPLSGFDDDWFEKLQNGILDKFHGLGPTDDPEVARQLTIAVRFGARNTWAVVKEGLKRVKDTSERRESPPNAPTYDQLLKNNQELRYAIRTIMGPYGGGVNEFVQGCIRDRINSRHWTDILQRPKLKDTADQLSATSLKFPANPNWYKAAADAEKDLEATVESESAKSNIEQAKTEVDQWPDWKVANMRTSFSEPPPVIPKQNSVIDLLHHTIKEQKEQISKLEDQRNKLNDLKNKGLERITELEAQIKDWEETTSEVHETNKILEAQLEEAHELKRDLLKSNQEYARCIDIEQARNKELETALKEARHLSEIRLHAAFGKESAEDRVRELEAKLERAKDALDKINHYLACDNINSAYFLSAEVLTEIDE
jgi:hypothetical protein